MGKKSTQLAEFVKMESTTVGKNNTPANVLHYKRLDDDSNKESKVTFLVGKVPGASEVLGAAKVGDHFVLEKEENDKGFWNASAFKPVTEWKPKPKKEYSQSGGYSKGEWKPKDETGVKVGAARKQAMTFLAATKGKSFTLDDVDTLAYEMLKRQAAQEAVVRNGESMPPNTPAYATEDQFTNDTGDDDVPF
jgi:hypothetical protein